MKTFSYVLITPARNEEATIGVTIESVISQTIQPREWVIVSDGSTDSTDNIIRAYASQNSFIRLLRLEKRPSRNFASVVFATEAGIGAIETQDFDFIGLLDADIRFGKNYYEEMLNRFAGDPKLGLAGGLVVDCYNGRHHFATQYLGEVAGAVQFFRRACFEGLGGLVAIPEGGWDNITCVRARMQGFKTRTFDEIRVDHLKPRNIAEGNLLRRTWQLGIREYVVGNHPLFEVIKCCYRLFRRPLFLGGLLRLGGYSWSCLTRRRRHLSSEIIQFIRQEQISRLWQTARSAASFPKGDGKGHS